MVVRMCLCVCAFLFAGCAGDGQMVEVPVSDTEVVTLGVNEYSGAMGSAIFVTVPEVGGGYAIHVLHGGGLLPLAAWSGTQLGSAKLLANGIEGSASKNTNTTEINAGTKVKSNTNVGVGVDVNTGKRY